MFRLNQSSWKKLTNRDDYIIKLKVDYIKHNTTVAFPSILFVKDKIPEIPYKITSKNNPDVVEGTLKVANNNLVQQAITD